MPTRARIALGGVLLVVAAVYALRFLLSGGAPVRIDSITMSWITGLRTPLLNSTISNLTVMFGPWAVTLWTGIIGLVLCVRDRTIRRAVALVSTVAAAAALCEVMKLVVARPRPPVADQLGLLETTYSFPSGHVTGTAALAFATAALTVGHMRRPATIVTWIGAATVVFIASATRLYLGAHWITDVMAAICVAGACALLVLPAVSAAADRRYPLLHRVSTDADHRTVSSRKLQKDCLSPVDQAQPPGYPPMSNDQQLHLTCRPVQAEHVCECGRVH